MNILMLSAGRRVELLKDIRKSMSEGSRIIATDLSEYAPALYEADKYYLVPRIDAPEYIDTVLDICKKESVDAVTTLIDPEIMILAENRARFEELGITVLAPFEDTAKLCFDKYEMYKYLTDKGVRTVRTWGSFDEVTAAIGSGQLAYPVFVKPRRGSGSVGAKKILDEEALKTAFDEDETLIVQEYMDCLDLDADIYVDTVSHEPVAIFSKKKISTTIGGANKTISFKDEKLFAFVKDFMKHFKFNGPLDADFFCRDGEYYLSEINPRFGGAYLHAYGAGVDFIKLIENNLKGNVNDSIIGRYDEGVVMMMYDSVVIKKPGELADPDRDRA